MLLLAREALQPSATCSLAAANGNWQPWPAAAKGTELRLCLQRQTLVALYALVTHALQRPQVCNVTHNDLNGIHLQLSQLHSWLAQASS